MIIMIRSSIVAVATMALAFLLVIGVSSVLGEEDVIPPTFGEDTTTPESTTGGQVTFRVEVTDDVGVHNVSVEFGDYGTYYYNWSEMEADGDTYTFDLTVPDYVVGSLSYRFHAWDVSGNNNTTEVRGVIIEDDDPPTATIVSTLPPTVDTGGSYEVIVNANDNVAVWSVTLYMEMEGVDDEPLLLPVPLQGQGQGWSAMVHMPTEHAGLITHHIVVADLYENELDLPQGTSDLVDTIPPDMETLIPLTTKVGEEVSIVVTATDNIGVAEVRWKGLPFEPDGIYANGTFDEPGEHKVKVTVVDAAGNEVVDDFIVFVEDDVDPTVVVLQVVLVLALVIVGLFLVRWMLERRASERKGDPELEDAPEDEIL